MLKRTQHPKRSLMAHRRNVRSRAFSRRLIYWQGSQTDAACLRLAILGPTNLSGFPSFSLHMALQGLEHSIRASPVERCVRDYTRAARTAASAHRDVGAHGLLLGLHGGKATL